ncbi:unnamed protein product [Rhodiola kirilowii]
MGDNSSCGSRAVDSNSYFSRKLAQKAEVCNEILRRLRDLDVEEASFPDFEDQLMAHFHRFTPSYAFDLNLERPLDVLVHKRLLQMASHSDTRPAIDIRLAQVHSPATDGIGYPAKASTPPSQIESLSSDFSSRQSLHSSPAPEILPSAELSLAVESPAQDVKSPGSSNPNFSGPMHEITISTYDMPKFLAQLTSILSDIGLNIQEAHAFSTIDGYSLDVFLVHNWGSKDTEKLRNILLTEILEIEKAHWSKSKVLPLTEHYHPDSIAVRKQVRIPCDGIDVWEIDARLFTLEAKISTRSHVNLFKGSYCGQDVAVKVLKSENLTDELRREFDQEVYVMKRVRHKNVVQFIGTCTRPPNLCILTEYMSGGSIYEFLHKEKGRFDLSSLLKVGMDVAKGMSYLHENNIIHRDLKSANLLMDEYNVVKVSDFGVARLLNTSGIMTAETGTYRWMAPEVIEHKPYNEKADVFSFGIVLWEIVTGQLPYENLTPLQAAIGVVQKGLRPTIPTNTHQKLVELIEICWHHDPALRPKFSEVIVALQQIHETVSKKRNKH